MFPFDLLEKEANTFNPFTHHHSGDYVSVVIGTLKPDLAVVNCDTFSAGEVPIAMAVLCCVVNSEL